MLFFILLSLFNEIKKLKIYLLFDEGKYEEALRLVNEEKKNEEKKDEKDEDFEIIMGYIYLTTGNYDLAKKYFENIGRDIAKYGLGISLLFLNEREKAKEILTELSEKKDYETETSYILSIIYYQEGFYQRAKALEPYELGDRERYTIKKISREKRKIFIYPTLSVSPLYTTNSTLTGKWDIYLDTDFSINSSFKSFQLNYIFSGEFNTLNPADIYYNSLDAYITIWNFEIENSFYFSIFKREFISVGNIFTPYYNFHGGTFSIGPYFEISGERGEIFGGSIKYSWDYVDFILSGGFLNYPFLEPILSISYGEKFFVSSYISSYFDFSGDSVLFSEIGFGLSQFDFLWQILKIEFAFSKEWQRFSAGTKFIFTF